MANNLIASRDEISADFASIGTKYNQSMANVVEAIGTAVTALDQIANIAGSTVQTQKVAKAALTKVATYLDVAPSPEFALRQEEIDAETATVSAPLPNEPQSIAPAANGGNAANLQVDATVQHAQDQAQPEPLVVPEPAPAQAPTQPETTGPMPSPRPPVQIIDANGNIIQQGQ